MKRKYIVWSAIIFVLVGLTMGVRHFGLLSCSGTSCDHSDGAAEEATHEGHDAHEENGAADMVRLDDKVMAEYGIETAKAGPGVLAVILTLPGEIALNADRVAHIVPRTPGIVREVFKNVGDQVEAGNVLAVIDSRELADLKAAYLAATEKTALAEITYAREESLWQKKISAQQDYLNAKSVLTEAKIELRAAEHKLHAMGLSEAYLKELPSLPHESFTRYAITAPLAGTIIEKHIVLGEAINEDRNCFTLADLGMVWVNLSVSAKDLGQVQAGQKVIISDGAAQESEGTISLVMPVVSEETRTALARVMLANPQGLWRAGQYVTGRVTTKEQRFNIVVPQEALTHLEGEPAVFVRSGDGYPLRRVTTGYSDSKGTEILTGLTAGEVYVTKGAFLLKTELLKPKGDEHGHGH